MSYSIDAADYVVPTTWTAARSWFNTTSATTGLIINQTEFVVEDITYEHTPEGVLLKKTVERAVNPTGSNAAPLPPLVIPYAGLMADEISKCELAADSIIDATWEDGAEDAVRLHIRTTLAKFLQESVKQQEDAVHREVADGVVRQTRAVNRMIDIFRNKAKTMMTETDDTIELAPGVYKHAIKKILDMCDLYDSSDKSL